MENDWSWIEDVVPFQINPNTNYLIDCSSEGFNEDLIRSKLIELFGYRSYEIDGNFNWFGNENIGDGAKVYLYLRFNSHSNTVNGGWDLSVHVKNDHVGEFMDRGCYINLWEFLGSFYGG
jgi:hypothetical protein